MLIAGSYDRWVHTLEDLTSRMSATARRKLFGDNARRFYRLVAYAMGC